MAQFFQSLGKLAQQGSAPAPIVETPPAAPPPAQSADEQFFQSLGKLAGGDVAPAPPEESQAAAPPPTQDAVMQFFQSLQRVTETNAAPLPPPIAETLPPVSAPMQNFGEQIFQSLETQPDGTEPPPSMDPVPRRVPIAPIRRVPRPPVAPVSPENVDEASLLTANGRGRAPQYRPKTPMRIAKFAASTQAAARPAVRPAPVVARPQASKTFAQQPHDEFDFADVSSDVERSARRDQKFRRFVLIEIIALVVLIPSAWLVLSRHVTSPALILLMNVLTIAAAVTMAVVPIVLYALAPGFGRPDR